jgi:MFS family permease
VIAGMGGVLYGYDIGIIGSALLYLDKSIVLSAKQTSQIVAALLGGGMLSSIVTGMLAEYVGRRAIILASAVLFIASIPIICFADGYLSLFLGRLLQGFSTGMIAVVIPLYLAECLNPNVRGRGMAIFQLMLNTGILAGGGVGALFTAHVESQAGSADHQLFLLIQDHAWRWMFSTAILPGVLFLAGGLFITESPRWLQRRGKTAQARAALMRSCTPDEAERELTAISTIDEQQIAAGLAHSLWQRRYILPFLITLTILGLNQATGINSMLGYVVVILHQAGMPNALASEASLAALVCLVAFTLLAVPLVDKLGRTVLLKIGTAGIVIAMMSCAGLYWHSESRGTDVTAQVRAAVTASGISLPVSELDGKPMRLAVLLDSGTGERLVTVTSSDTFTSPDTQPMLKVEAPASPASITILRATRGEVPSPMLAWLVLASVMLFIASYAFGPGVCVWLVLSELMPTRIRSNGIGIALVFNQGISTLIAARFLPVVCDHGYAVMFLAWGLATVLYFLVSAFILPETKGRSLEEIEAMFAAKPP